LPFRAQVGDTFAFLQLGWGGILGAQFGLGPGVQWAVVSAAAGFILVLAWRLRQPADALLASGLERLLFWLGELALIALALATHLLQ
jgi:hypothetical protein